MCLLLFERELSKDTTGRVLKFPLHGGFGGNHCIMWVSVIYQWIVVMTKTMKPQRMLLSQVGIDTTPALALFGRSVGCLAVWNAWLQRTSWDQLAGRAGDPSRNITLRSLFCCVLLQTRHKTGCSSINPRATKLFLLHRLPGGGYHPLWI